LLREIVGIVKGWNRFALFIARQIRPAKRSKMRRCGEGDWYGIVMLMPPLCHRGGTGGVADAMRIAYDARFSRAAFLSAVFMNRFGKD
jgi:hypothetical protein